MPASTSRAPMRLTSGASALSPDVSALRRFIPIVAAAVVCATTGAGGREQTAGVVGTVVDASTGLPIADVEVTASQRGSPRRGSLATPRTRTNAAGEFRLANLPSGRHWIEASHRDYLQGSAGLATFGALPMPTEVRPGETAEARIRLWKHAAISGQVRSADGRAIVAAKVTALVASEICGTKELEIGPSTVTKNDGTYSIQGLQPGEYLPVTQVNGMVAVYSPGVTSPQWAFVSAARPGSEVSGADIVVPNQPGETITGSFVPAQPTDYAMPTTVDLFPASSEGIKSHLPSARVNVVGGRFRFERVNAGNYIVRASIMPPTSTGMFRQSGGSWTPPNQRSTGVIQTSAAEPSWWAEEAVAVRDETVHIAVPLRRGLRIRGRLDVSLVASEAAKRIRELPIVMTRDDGVAFGAYSTPAIDEKGQFETAGVPRGSYVFQIPWPELTGVNLYLAKVTVEGRDWTGQGIPLTSGDVAGVVVYLTDRPGRVAGQILASSDLDRFGGTAYAFPTNEQQWTGCGPLAPRMAFAAVNRDGGFVFDRLPIGEYWVAAVVGGEFRYARPDYLRRLLPTAQKVKVDIGTSSNVTLKAGPRAH